MDNTLLELVCTRISHDLVGNMGAVANTVEMLEGETDISAVQDSLPILKIGSGVVIARLKFFRMAFGTEGPNLTDAAKVEQTIREYLATLGGKNAPKLEFALENSRCSRAVMLSVMAIADLMAYGGVIKVVGQGEKVEISVSAETKLVEAKLAQLLAILKSSATEVSSLDVPLLCLLEVCRSKGIKLSFGSNPVLRFVLE